MRSVVEDRCEETVTAGHLDIEVEHGLCRRDGVETGTWLDDAGLDRAAPVDRAMRVARQQRFRLLPGPGPLRRALGLGTSPTLGLCLGGGAEVGILEPEGLDLSLKILADLASGRRLRPPGLGRAVEEVREPALSRLGTAADEEGENQAQRCEGPDGYRVPRL
ncbi:MAG: hypothetical protein ABW143_02660 [Acidimicrobiales bacterium]